MSKLDYSKVETIHVEMPTSVGDVTTYARVTYKSGVSRTFLVDTGREDALITKAREAGIPCTGFGLEPVVSQPAGNVLVEMLGLSPDQATRLQGADRLNFWRNGSLSVQIQHGTRSVKVVCPKAVITDAQLIEHFAAWGWQQLSGKLYFRCTPASLVQL
jgi:hypothetical protein